MSLAPASADQVRNGSFDRDIAIIQGIRSVPTILRVLCDTTGMRFGAIGRVTEIEWVACAVVDRIGV